MTQKNFMEKLFEEHPREIGEIVEITKILKLLKSSGEENNIYTTTFHST